MAFSWDFYTREKRERNESQGKDVKAYLLRTWLHDMIEN